MELKKVKLYDEQHILYSCSKDLIEKYQVKMLYYADIEGCIETRISRDEQNYFLYFNVSNKMSLEEFLKKELRNIDINNIVKNICQIIKESKWFMLYENRFMLDPKYIFIKDYPKSLNLELIYLPVKETKVIENNYADVIKCIADAYNNNGNMEGFYYFIRLHEECKKDMEIHKLIEHIEKFIIEK